MCYACKKTYSIDNFYRNKCMKDGRANECKKCSKKRVRKWKLENKSRVNESAAKSQKNSRDRINARRRKYYYANKEKILRACKKYREKNLHKARAHQTVCRAVEDGKLLKPEKCDFCSNGSVEIAAHHEDYSKPLDVVWLCKVCHTRLHFGTTDESIEIRKKYCTKETNEKPI